MSRGHQRRCSDPSASIDTWLRAGGGGVRAREPQQRSRHPSETECTVLYCAALYCTVQHCEHGGECFYNTLTVYTNTGALAAVYHKYNLWTSELTQFDIDPAGPQVDCNI